MRRGNIRANFPDVSHGEAVEGLAAMRGGLTVIERIVSGGQASPPGFWYDQAWDEWVLILSGEAELEFDNPAGEERLGVGDWLLIPAHVRHRVRSTADPTVWLAAHVGKEEDIEAAGEKAKHDKDPNHEKEKAATQAKIAKARDTVVSILAMTDVARKAKKTHPGDL